MENATEIAKGVYWVGAKDPGRKSFDALVPLPIGTTYNAYLIKGSQKTALLDTVDPTKLDVLLDNLKSIDRIDYIVSHHAEQDHSGSILKILEKYPRAKVVTSPKGKEFLSDLIHLESTKVITVADREKLDLGEKTLEFIYIPWSHWPETMASFLLEDRILFPCDLFGLHWSKTGLYETDKNVLEESAKRYYAEIMMPYAQVIKRHLPVLSALNPAIIAPSHGPVLNEPAFIMDLYRRWILEAPSNLAVIPYVSMHGSTEQMVMALKDRLEKRGIRAIAFNTEGYDVGEFAISLVDAATIVFATPTVVGGMHPAVASAAFITNIIRPKARWIGLIGSYGWGGHTAVQFRRLFDEVSPEFLEPVLLKGLPQPKDYDKLDALAHLIAEKHTSLISPASPSPIATG